MSRSNCLKTAQREALQRRSQALRRLHHELEAEGRVLEATLEKESVDAELIESRSLEWFSAWRDIRTRSRVQQERDEALNAGFERMAHEEAVIHIEDEIERLEEQLTALAGPSMRAPPGVHAQLVQGYLAGLCLPWLEAATTESTSDASEQRAFRVAACWVSEIDGPVPRALAHARADVGQLQRLSDDTSWQVHRNPTTAEMTLAAWIERRGLQKQRGRVLEELQRARATERNERIDVLQLRTVGVRRWAAWLRGDLADDLSREHGEYVQALRVRVRLESELAAIETSLERPLPEAPEDEHHTSELAWTYLEHTREIERLQHLGETLAAFIDSPPVWSGQSASRKRASLRRRRKALERINPQLAATDHPIQLLDPQLLAQAETALGAAVRSGVRRPLPPRRERPLRERDGSVRLELDTRELQAAIADWGTPSGGIGDLLEAHLTDLLERASEIRSAIASVEANLDALEEQARSLAEQADSAPDDG